MQEIKIDLNSEQFDDLIKALEEAKDIQESLGKKNRVSAYANLQSAILIQRAYQEYALIQSTRILNPRE